VHSPSLNANFARGGADTQEQAMLNGSAGEDNQFTYGATAAHSRVVGSSIGVNGGYRGPFAVLNASIGRGQGYSQASFGMSGAALAHAGGITLGQPTGETVGLAHVPGARGARLLNAAGARVDRFGYALVPYLTPYALNTVEVDPKGLPLDVQLQATSARVAPHAGAVVQLEFKTQQGRAMILQVRREDGSALPFGTQIVDAKGVPLGVTGQAGRALLRGLKPDQRLLARWQDADASQRTCSFDFVAPPRTTELLQARTSATYVCRVPR
jgi:outer membrane usher protein